MTEIKRVLIVEDRQDYQKIFRDIIKSTSYEYEIAANVEEGKAQLSQKSFHVALVDLSLDNDDPHNRDGFKVLEHIKTIDEGTKAIVLTAFGEVEDADTTFTKYGLFGFIRKDRMNIKAVKERIVAATEQAQSKMDRKRLTYVTHLLKIPPVAQYLEILESASKDFVQSLRQSQELEPFLTRLLSKWLPILPHKHDITGYQHHLEDASTSVRVRFWSKALGKPIEAWFGKFDEMQVAVRAIDESSSKLQEVGYENKVGEVFDAFSFPRLGGAVYTLQGVSFDEFVP